MTKPQTWIIIGEHGKEVKVIKFSDHEAELKKFNALNDFLFKDWKSCAKQKLKDKVVKEFRRTKYNITFSRIEDFIDEVFEE